uniref:Purple acid phosphatase n=1 Tax=Leersia perrieri TaxID=77586 RepID=A0A0D9Y1T9_9ORYZ
MAMESRRRSSITTIFVILVLMAAAEAMKPCPGTTSGYRRKKKKAAEAMEDMPLDADVFAEPPGRNAPQQEAGNSTVMYGKAMDKLDMAAEGNHTRHKYYNYTSGHIHHCTLVNLEYGVKYYYAMGFGYTVRTFWFTTPPKPGPDVPFRLGLIGQTFDSNATLTHHHSSGAAAAVLFVGDLSYADKHPFHDNTRWDTWGRFSERSVAYQPWIWVAGNHEIDYAPELGETTPFKPFTHRYPTPHLASGSPEPYCNNFHYMEGEPMRVEFERMAVDARVDLVFSGHVHAYERSFRVSNLRYNITDGLCTPVRDRRAPVYVTIGDGGNIEGPADEMTWPQPAYSAFREDSFGHAVLDIKNRTHAYYAWYRNDDGEKVAADAVWFTNRYHMPNHDDSAAAAGNKKRR